MPLAGPFTNRQAGKSEPGTLAGRILAYLDTRLVLGCRGIINFWRGRVCWHHANLWHAVDGDDEGFTCLAPFHKLFPAFDGLSDERRLQWSLWLWRDLYNWVRVHGSLEGRTPAMAAGLSMRVWSVMDYARHPVHVDDLTRAIWAEEREIALTSAVERETPRKSLPAS